MLICPWCGWVWSSPPVRSCPNCGRRDDDDDVADLEPDRLDRAG